MQICNRPTSPPASRDISRSELFTIGKISSARLSSRLPAEVNRGGFVLRTKSGHSSLSSRSFSWCDNADCVTKRLSAASTRLPVSRSATSVFRCRSSITNFTIAFRKHLIHPQKRKSEWRYFNVYSFFAKITHFGRSVTIYARTFPESRLGLTGVAEQTQWLTYQYRIKVNEPACLTHHQWSSKPLWTNS